MKIGFYITSFGGQAHPHQQVAAPLKWVLLSHFAHVKSKTQVDATRFLRPHTWYTAEQRHCSSFTSWPPGGGEETTVGHTESREKQCLLGTCRKFPHSSVQNQHFCAPQGPAFFLPWRMNGAYHAYSNILKGFDFIFATWPHKINWGVGFLLLAFKHPCFSPNWLFCSPHAGMREKDRMVWEGRGHVARLIFRALGHHSLKPCFLEGCRLRLSAPLWAASQCPLGRTAGHHILQTLLASFVLLENGAHLVLERTLQKSCVLESLGMLLHLTFEFSVVLTRKCFFGVMLFFLLHF